MVVRMKESYGEGLATRTGPESCGGVREGVDEALTGERAGWVSSRESANLWDADAVRKCGRRNQEHRNREVLTSPTRSQTPCTFGNTMLGNREIRCSPAANVATGRVEKSKDVRRR